MGERGMAIRSGITKQGWENAEFPILCETCLGDNPYVRMMKQNFGVVCKICDRPYTLFRWKAGTQGRFKQTIVCQTCAKIKNLCQTCLFDLDFGLPVELRDKLLDERKVNMPQNIAMRDYFVDQVNQNLDTVKLPYEELKNHPLLEKLRRKVTNFDRNKAYLCSFFAKGTCTRGEECPYRHELPNPEDEKYNQVNHEQNIKNRFYGKNDALAQKMVDGLQRHMPHPPANKNIKTLLVHNCADVTKNELQKFFEKGFQVNGVYKMDKIAFVEFNERQMAEDAMKSYYGRLIINNASLGLSWKREAEEEDEASDEGLLIPGSGFKLLKKDIHTKQPPKTPTLPPKDIGNDVKQQHKFLMDMLGKKDTKYPSMNPLALGGVEKKVKKE